MQTTTKFFLLTGFLFLLTLSPSSFPQSTEIEVLTKRLEKSLNDKKKNEFYKLVSKDIVKELEKKYDEFHKSFPNAKWEIKASKKLKNNRQLIDVIVTANKYEGNHNYSLISNQKLAINSKDGIIIKKEILSDYSILNSNKDKLEITIGIPDIVLTGSKYDIDIIIQKPLKERILAGGLIQLNAQRNSSNLIKEMELKPMGSGGLFKTARAPYKPGKQKWAAVIAHPQGIVSITKTVRIVSKTSNLKD